MTLRGALGRRATASTDGKHDEQPESDEPDHHDEQPDPLATGHELEGTKCESQPLTTS